MTFPFLAPSPPEPVAPGPVPTFAVIIPAYQAAAFVGDAVRSALEQTVPPLEVIVCDDGSTDDLDGALAPFRDRIQIVRQENRGLPAAKNSAARAAKATFVAVLDADDIYLPRRREAMGFLAAARPDLDIVTTDVFIEIGGEVVGRFTAQNPFVVDDQRAAILRRNLIWSGAGVKREVLLANDGFDETVDCADDWDCWRRLIHGGSQIGLVDEPLAHYRIRPGSMSASRARDLAGRVDVLERALRDERLTDAELAIAAETLGRTRPLALLAAAQDALRLGAPERRRRALDVARTRGLPRRVRAKALAAAAAPGAAGRRLQAPLRTKWGQAGAVAINESGAADPRP